MSIRGDGRCAGSWLNAGAQDVMWNSVGETIHRELPRMKEVAVSLAQAPAGGSCSFT